jgi:hypothetical protein
VRDADVSWLRTFLVAIKNIEAGMAREIND